MVAIKPKIRAWNLFKEHVRDEMSCASIARKYSISRERVKQIVGKVVRDAHNYESNGSVRLYWRGREETKRPDEDGKCVSSAWKRLRFEILMRDKFTCQYCGRNPRTNPGCELQIDHIHPQAKGGKDNKENLITSCRECNIGKSDVLLNWEEICPNSGQ